MNQPSNGLSTLALLLTVAVLSGCTSMHVVEYTQGASLPPAVEVGDRIRVLDSAGLGHLAGAAAASVALAGL